MRKARNLTAAVAAIAGLGLAASPALADNVYTINGSGPTGGTPTKPKPATFKESYTIKSTLGDSIVPDVVAKYKIVIEGGRVNKTALAKMPKCVAQADTDPEQTDTQCPAGGKSVVGKGVLQATVGVPGQPITPAYNCTLPFNEHNIGGGLLGLFVNASSDQCLIPIKKWIRVKVTQQGRNAVSEFTVPENLQQPITGTFSPVLSVNLAFNAVPVKVGGKTIHVHETIGCTDKKREVSVTFTERSGRSVKAMKVLPC